ALGAALGDDPDGCPASTNEQHVCVRINRQLTRVRSDREQIDLETRWEFDALENVPDRRGVVTGLLNAWRSGIDTYDFELLRFLRALLSSRSEGGCHKHRCQQNDGETCPHASSFNELVADGNSEVSRISV